MKAYFTCLASYNNGASHGKWVDLDGLDANDIQDAINAILKDSGEPGAEEWAIHDYDDAANLASTLGENPNLETLAATSEAVTEITDDWGAEIGPKLIEWVSDKVLEPGNWKSHLDDAFCGFSTAEDFAATEVEAYGDIPEHLENYIDYCAIARDMALNGEVDFICEYTGAYLQDYNSMGCDAIVLRNF